MPCVLVRVNDWYMGLEEAGLGGGLRVGPEGEGVEVCCIVAVALVRRHQRCHAGACPMIVPCAGLQEAQQAVKAPSHRQASRVGSRSYLLQPTRAPVESSKMAPGSCLELNEPEERRTME